MWSMIFHTCQSTITAKTFEQISHISSTLNPKNARYLACICIILKVHEFKEKVNTTRHHTNHNQESYTTRQCITSISHIPNGCKMPPSQLQHNKRSFKPTKYTFCQNQGLTGTAPERAKSTSKLRSACGLQNLFLGKQVLFQALGIPIKILTCL